jgi:hypothetical protein
MEARDGLADDEVAEQVRRTCRTVLGETLRSITYFTPDAYEQLYLRADLEADADLTGFVEHESLGFRARTAYRGSELGDYEHTIRSFENGYITRVVSHEEGVFVTTDGLTMRRSEEVASALVEVLS